MALGEIGEDFLLHRGESRGASEESFVARFQSEQCFVGREGGFCVRAHVGNSNGSYLKRFYAPRRARVSDLGPTSSARASRRSIRVGLQDLQHVRDGVRILMRAVDWTERCSASARRPCAPAPVRHNAVARVWRIATAAIADDRVVRDAGRHRDGVESHSRTGSSAKAYRRCSRDVSVSILLRDVLGSAQHLVARLAGEGRVARSDSRDLVQPATREIAAAQRRRDENHAPDFRADGGRIVPARKYSRIFGESGT